MENYFNIIHYSLYKAHYKIHLMANKINPFWLLAKIPFLKKRHQDLGIDVHKEINKAFEDKDFGLSVVVAGGFLWGWMALLFFSLLMLFDVDISTVYVIGCAAISGIICYVFFFKNDKYIDYFDQYEKCSTAEKNKYGWLTAASVIAVFFLFYLGLTT